MSLIQPAEKRPHLLLLFVLLAGRAGRAIFAERAFDRSPARWRELRYRFRIA